MHILPTLLSGLQCQNYWLHPCHFQFRSMTCPQAWFSSLAYAATWTCEGHWNYAPCWSWGK
jgi:hypothetical protein